jgi:hypothetical protein
MSEEDSNSKAPRAKKRGCLRACFILFIVLMVFLYAGCVLGVGTARGRALLEKALTRYTGGEVTIVKAQLGIDLKLSDVVFGPSSDQSGGQIKIKTLRIGYAWPMRCRLNLNGAEAILVRGQNGQWRPALAAPLGDIPLKRISDFAELAEGWREKMLIDVEDSDIQWVDESGDVLARVEGLQFLSRPVEIPGRKAEYYRMSARLFAVPGVDRSQIQDVMREWLLLGEEAYFEIGREGSGNGSSGDFWELMK